MDVDPSTELAARVAQWHNRHPLARRIAPEQVAGLGVLKLPFIATDPRPAKPWQRLLAKVLRPARAFDEEVIDHLKPARLARFAWAHGAPERPGASDWPQRDMLPTRAAADTPLVFRHLRTAAIEVGSQRVRVLIGQGASPRLLGARLLSRHRILGGAGALVAAIGLVVTLATVVSGTGQHRDAGVLSAAIAPSSPRAAASEAAAALPPAGMAASGAAALTGGRLAASGPSTASAAASSTLASASAASAPPPIAVARAGHSASLPATDAAAPPPAPPQTASGALLPVLPAEVRAAAKAQAEALRGHPANARQAAAGASRPGAPASGASAASGGRVYAVATMPTKSRAASQLRIVLINAPMKAEPGQARAEIMQIGEEFRAVIWPYHDREAAEQTRGLLAARGVKAEIIEF